MVDVFLIVSAAVVLVVIYFLGNSVLLVHQAEAMVVERLGRFLPCSPLDYSSSFPFWTSHGP
jgi:hypothetical protein